MIRFTFQHAGQARSADLLFTGNGYTNASFIEYLSDAAISRYRVDHSRTAQTYIEAGIGRMIRWCGGKVLTVQTFFAPAQLTGRRQDMLHELDGPAGIQMAARLRALQNGTHIRPLPRNVQVHLIGKWTAGQPIVECGAADRVRAIVQIECTPFVVQARATLLECLQQGDRLFEKGYVSEEDLAEYHDINKRFIRSLSSKALTRQSPRPWHATNICRSPQ